MVNCCSVVIPSSSYAEAHLVCLPALTVRYLALPVACSAVILRILAFPPQVAVQGWGAYLVAAAAQQEFHTDISRFLDCPLLQNCRTQECGYSGIVQENRAADLVMLQVSNGDARPELIPALLSRDRVEWTGCRENTPMRSPFDGAFSFFSSACRRVAPRARPHSRTTAR